MAAAPTFKVLGQAIPRVEGPEKITGRAKNCLNFIKAHSW